MSSSPSNEQSTVTENGEIAAPPPQERLTTEQVCERLRKQVYNLERTLRCPICHSCFRSATMIAVCCHTYCHSCLQRLRPIKSCAICNQKCSHRSLVPAAGMDLLVRRFKETAQALGLLPARYDASLALTQLAPVESQLPPSQHSLADVHDQLRAARTFAKYAPAAESWQGEHAALVQNAEAALVEVTVRKKETKSGGAEPKTVPNEAEPEATLEAATTVAVTNAETSTMMATDSSDETNDSSATTKDFSSPKAADRQAEESGLCEATKRRGTLSATSEASPGNDDQGDVKMPATTAEEPAAVDEKVSGESEPTAHMSDEDEKNESQTDNAEEDTKMPASTENMVPSPTTDSDDSAPEEATRQVIESESRKSRRGLATRRSDSHPRQAQSSVVTPSPHAAAAAARATSHAPESFTERATFAVGDIVQVQARTWPGVNLPGGVGRVRAIHQDKEHVCYDVDYVLGGRERKVDAIFCATTDLPRMGRRKSNQAQAVASQRLEKKQQDGVLPPTLLQQLKSEGFDVEGKVKPESLAVTPTPNGARSSVRGTSSSRRSVMKENVSPKNPPASKPSRKRKSSENNNTGKAEVKRRRTGGSILSRVASSLGRRKTHAVAPAPVVLSDAQACDAADEKYLQRFEKAMAKSTVSIVTTGLSEHETKQVELLCSQQKKIRIRLSSTVTKQTTVCITSADPKEPAMAKVRTAKAMRAALLGIPLVTPAWIYTCLSSKERIVPPNQYLRSLPTKGDSKAVGMFGLAHLASRSQGLLSNQQVFLCLPSRLQQDVTTLIKDAGGTITGRLVPSSSPQPPLLVLCGDTDHNVSAAVQKVVGKNPESFQVVHSRWLFDSISHGSPVKDLASYRPPSTKAKALWNLCLPKQS